MMEKSYELEKMLKSGKGLKITGFIILVIGAMLGFLLGSDELSAGIGIFVLLAILGATFFICGAAVSSSKRKTIDRLEENGEMQAVIDDYNAETTIKLDKKGLSAIGEKYLFALTAGRIYKYEDILWVYITVQRQNGIPISQMLNIRDFDGKSCALVNEKPGKKGAEKLNALIAAIAARNPKCMCGFTRENAKLYKAAVKEYKASR